MVLSFVDVLCFLLLSFIYLKNFFEPGIVVGI